MAKQNESKIYTPYGQTKISVNNYPKVIMHSSESKNKSYESKIYTPSIFTKTKIQFSETKNKKLKHKIHYLHAFWRLNIADLDFSLSTQLLLKKFGISSVYSLHYFILKRSGLLPFNKQQQKEIIKTYYRFGFNSPFV